MTEYLPSVHPDHAVVWYQSTIFLLDQRILPSREKFLRIDTAEQTAQAISDMVVRGAPAIGVTAAYGFVLAWQQVMAQSGETGQRRLERLTALQRKLASARPTAVNLAWALDRMRACCDEAVASGADDRQIHQSLEQQAQSIHRQDIESNQTMGRLGAELIEQGSRLITHCNAGALATGGYGTALGVVRKAHELGKLDRVYADETRPWLQGSRLTAWELQRQNIPVTLMAEGAAASCMRQNKISWVVVGADRVAANGDVANKIGTLNLAIMARQLGVQFMVVAPLSTIDPNTVCGQDIPIECRSPDELFHCGGERIAADGIEAWNPVFDVTPAELVTCLVTERGVVSRPNRDKIAALLA